jgi:hypothetical protein
MNENQGKRDPNVQVPLQNPYMTQRLQQLAVDDGEQEFEDYDETFENHFSKLMRPIQ